MGKDSKGSEPADLVKGEDKRTEFKESDSLTYRPRKSIETWLQGTTDTEPDTSTLSKKRKRSNPSIAAPSTPPEICASYLNLEEIEFKMPPKTDSNYPTTPTNNKTPRSNKSKASKVSADADWVRQRLAQFHMYRGKKEVFDRYPNFQKKIREIVEGSRHSAPRADSERRFEEAHDQLKSANESTLMEHLIPMIIPFSREVRAVPQNPSGLGYPQSESSQTASKSLPAPLITEEPWLVKFFWDSGCVRQTNVNFRDTFLPIPADLAAAMSKDPVKEGAMTNPRPDYIYGLGVHHFPPPADVLISQRTEMLRQIVPRVYDCMLVIEGKSDRGEAAEAENQACRAGAALVNAARMLRERIGEEDVAADGPDERTFVFSGTLCPGHMEIWVNWAEVRYTTERREVERDNKMVTEDYKKKEVDFHMNLLYSKSLASPDFLKEMRPVCNNILDWGCINRYNNDLKHLYERIYEFERKRAAHELTQTPSKSINPPQTGSKRQKTN